MAAFWIQQCDLCGRRRESLELRLLQSTQPAYVCGECIAGRLRGIALMIDDGGKAKLLDRARQERRVVLYTTEFLFSFAASGQRPRHSHLEADVVHGKARVD